MNRNAFGKVSGKVVDGIFSIIYDKDKNYERWLVLLTLVGFILRFISAIHEGFFADDAIYASQSAGIFQSGILSTHSHPALFSYLTDLAYHILGYTTLAARLFPLITGTLLIVLSFLIGTKLFNKKIGLASAFFVTFSNFLVRMTFTEHTLVTLFFIFFGIYSGLLYLEKRKITMLIITAIAFGLGDLTKYNSPFFIIAFLVFGAYYVKSKKEIILSQRNVKHLVVFGVIIVILAMPFLAFNYFIYKEKGIADFQFTRIFKPEKAQQLYGDLAGQDKSFAQSLLTPGNYINYQLPFMTDLVLTLFAIAGLFLLFKRKLSRQFYFILIILLIPFVLQSAGSALAKHFAFMQFTLAFPAGYALNALFEKMKGRWIKILAVLVLLLIWIVNLGVAVGVPQTYLSPSGASELKSYINGNVKSQDLIVFDQRIYTALSYWFGTDHNLLTTPDFINFYEYNQNISSNQKQMVTVYFVECAIDDCGWGWVAQQPELNKSAEYFFATVANQSALVADLEGRKYPGNEFLSKPEIYSEYKVYKARVPLAPALVEQTKYVNSFYFVPYLYLNMQNYIYNYHTLGIGTLVNTLSLWIIYLAIVLALVIMIITLIIVLIPMEEIIEDLS